MSLRTPGRRWPVSKDFYLDEEIRVLPSSSGSLARPCGTTKALIIVADRPVGEELQRSRVSPYSSPRLKSDKAHGSRREARLAHSLRVDLARRLADEAQPAA
ncbi:hypothetical protein CIHG_05266 [Coccidioides immitis H538.4]|uniref:Uncharacterized protein n=3 Tax=Coccidioides immitis TaxID=5501 RepID=A0A0J8R4M2_COCIT|nr:hypothetical protein CIRG_08333 [Coccidioides immitis RMSCC 2394]KMU78653.1 hypothetical protein CISG_01692 [Coccidioides immitis RMSCC 3703]KMU87470.1 hypothetical protein CIHG_05266 [Coccidioides immitis H538.4]